MKDLKLLIEAFFMFDQDGGKIVDSNLIFLIKEFIFIKDPPTQMDSPYNIQKI